MTSKSARRIAGGAAIGILGAATGLAQVDPPGGIDLGFSINQRFVASDNAALDPDPEGTTYRADTSLGFRLSSETRIDSLVLTGNTTYRYVDGPDVSESDLADPRFTLGYTRQGANSAAAANLSYRSSDVEFLRLTDLVDENGELLEDVDPDDLEGTGRRIDASASASLTLGQEGPLGATFALSRSETDYVDTTDSDLVDVERLSASVDLRFGLSPVLDATTRFGYSEIDPADDTSFETTSVDAGLTLRRPTGALSFSVGYADTDSGERTSFSIGRQLSLPRGSISANLGATRDPSGQTSLTGALSVRRDLRDGSFTLSARRNSTTTDDGERLVTAVSAVYSRPLTRRTNLSIDAGFVLSEDTAAETDSQAANVGATLGYQLTDDWSLTLGYDYRQRSETGEEDASDNSISLGIGRSFTFPIR